MCRLTEGKLEVVVEGRSQSLHTSPERHGNRKSEQTAASLEWDKAH